jgi:hypothetical protein
MARTDARFICLSTTSPSRLLVACWLRASLRGRTALNREILMRRCVITFFGACLSLFLCLPLHGQTSSGRTSIHPQTADDDDPGDILEVGAATSWNTTGGAATFAPNLLSKQRLSKTGWSLRWESRPFTLGTLQSGIRICSSRSRGHYPRKRSSCLASGLNGFT